jgi:hypothetical protein
MLRETDGTWDNGYTHEVNTLRETGGTWDNGDNTRAAEFMQPSGHVGSVPHK